MGAASTAAWVGAAIAAAGAAVSIDEQKAQGRDQERANRANQRTQQLKAARERRQQVRQARIEQSNIAATAGATGGSETSAAVGGRGAVVSNAGGNISFLNQVEGLTKRQSIFQQDAADHATKAGVATSVGNVGSSVFSVAAANGGTKDWFKD